MGSRLFIVASSLLFALTGTARAIAPMAGSCDGAQETPPNASPATGEGRFVIDTASDRLYYHISFSGLLGAETASHIHGYVGPGFPGGVVHALPLGSPKIGVWSYPAANEAQILAGLTYINIHSSSFPGGEIRGQIVSSPATNLVALCEGGQEVPPNASPGIGIGFFQIDTSANTLSYDIRFGNLLATETAAHIHGFAPPGMNAGVLHVLPAGSPKIGVWNYLESQEGNILAGLTYANVHSSSFPGGEIRGQIVAPNPATDAPVLPASSSRLSLVAAPNPVESGRGSVALFYRTPGARDLRLAIYDTAGRLVRTLHSGRAEASGRLAWDARDDAGSLVSAGVYFARLEAGGDSETRPITLLK